jgi:hypothetical protein
MCLHSIDRIRAAFLEGRVLGDGLATNMTMMALVLLCPSSGSAQAIDSSPYGSLSERIRVG